MRILSIQKGDYVRKRNFAFFKTWKKVYTPVIQIESIAVLDTEGENILINGKYNYRSEDIDSIIIISEAAAEKLKAEWYDKTLFELVEPQNKSIDETCYTTYTGKKTEKKKFENLFELKRVYFQLSHQYPEKKFQMYKCPNCKGYHIGKDEDIK